MKITKTSKEKIQIFIVNPIIKLECTPNLLFHQNIRLKVVCKQKSQMNSIVLKIHFKTSTQMVNRMFRQ